MFSWFRRNDGDVTGKSDNDVDAPALDNSVPYSSSPRIDEDGVRACPGIRIYDASTMLRMLENGPSFADRSTPTEEEVAALDQRLAQKRQELGLADPRNRIRGCWSSLPKI